MEYLPPEPPPPEGPAPVLECARPQTQIKGDTPVYVRTATLMVSIPAILIALPFGCGGIVMVSHWISGSNTPDGGEGLRLLIVSGFLLITGVFGVCVSMRQKQ